MWLSIKLKDTSGLYSPAAMVLKTQSLSLSDWVVSDSDTRWYTYSNTSYYSNCDSDQIYFTLTLSFTFFSQLLFTELVIVIMQSFIQSFAIRFMNDDSFWHGISLSVSVTHVNHSYSVIDWFSDWLWVIQWLRLRATVRLRAARIRGWHWQWSWIMDASPTLLLTLLVTCLLSSICSVA